MLRCPWVSSLALIALCAARAEARALEPGDFDRLMAVDNLACSSDGRWVAYTVEGSASDADQRRVSLRMVRFDGTESLELTAAVESATIPRFSPDGRYLSFLSTRGTEGKSQIYLLDLRGGDARPITQLDGEIADYGWSPDGTQLVVSMAAEEKGDKAKGAKPIVIDRLHFKEDRTGYLTAADRTHLYLVNLETRVVSPLTRDAGADDSSPVFSPDGTRIAFFSNRDLDADRSGELALYLVEAKPDGAVRKLTEFQAPNKPALLWTKDGSRLIFTTGLEPRLNAYIQDRLSVVQVSDGKARLLTDRLDRALTQPALIAPDALGAILEDDGSEVPVSVRLDSGATERRVQGQMSASALCSGGGHTAVIVSTDRAPAEVFALEGAKLRRLSHHNDAVMGEITLGAVEDIAFPSRDGTMIHGIMVKPPDFRAGVTYPTLLWIHGGPNGQDSHGLGVDTYPLELERQLFAARGYVVLGINYRGSSGRGAAFAEAIAGDWGDKEVADLLAGVDYVVRSKIADPARLGIGGWSYGGILTDYVVASDGRFKAAISGAGSGNQLSMYGSDEYVLQYNAELGPPWRSTARWLKLSYPFFHADRIKTPTLFLGGASDFNVPVAGGEQMYEALRTLGVPTQLIVYPGQYHLLTRPSFIRDRLQRYLEWFDRYLKTPVPSAHPG